MGVQYLQEKKQTTTRKTTAKTPKKSENTTPQPTKRKNTSNQRKTSYQPAKQQFGDSLKDEILLIAIIVLSLVMLISQITDHMGLLGSMFRSILQGFLGFGGFLLPVMIILYCIWMLLSQEHPWMMVRVMGGILLLLTVASASYLFHPYTMENGIGFFTKCVTLYQKGTLTNGGLIGGLIGGLFLKLFDTIGSVILLFALLVISLIMATGRSFFAVIGHYISYWREKSQEYQQIKNERIKIRAERIREQEEEQWIPENNPPMQKSKRNKRENYNFEIAEEPKKTEQPQIQETVFHKKRSNLRVKKREPIYDFVKESESWNVQEEANKPRNFRVMIDGKTEEMFSEVPIQTKEETAKNSTMSENNVSEVHMPEMEAVHITQPVEQNKYTTQQDAVAALTAEALRAAEQRMDIAVNTECKEESIHTNGNMISEEIETKEIEQKETDIIKEDTVEDTPKEIQVEQETVQAVDTVQDTQAAEEDNVEILAELPEEEEKPYEFPPIELLGKDPGVGRMGSKAEMIDTAKKLETTMKSFGVDAKVVQINKGPTVTRYEVSPSQGVKVSKIVNLADDIALNLAANGIRMEAPIPGKAAVGIEVPNQQTESVYLRTVLESEQFKEHPSKLAFALGVDIEGNPVVTDIAKMPHLLIAGATGSGKSVCINTLITSILYKATPKEVKLLLVDPKVVELSVYNGIPHLLIPVVTDPKKAAAALNWAVREMLQRYNEFAACGVRDMKGFNKQKEQAGDPEGKMAQIVIVIDELADLMMAASGEVEDAICRLAQMARAAGMHLIIATQRPSVDVLTGVIKANIPSRLAFAVSSGIDSRTILDTVGAEKLLGKGDMLFYPSGQSKPARMQGAFVTDEEVEEIVSFLRQNSKPSYTKEMVETITATSATSGGGNEEVDEFYEQAVDLIIEKKKASVSMLQRQFRIGYNRASRLMEDLETRGMVGPEDGSKPRKVLITAAQWDELRGITPQEERDEDEMES